MNFISSNVTMAQDEQVVVGESGAIGQVASEVMLAATCSSGQTSDQALRDTRGNRDGRDCSNAGKLCTSRDSNLELQAGGLQRVLYFHNLPGRLEVVSASKAVRSEI